MDSALLEGGPAGTLARPDYRVMGIDPGSSLGWAHDLAGSLKWGTADMSMRKVSTEGLRWLQFTNFMREHLAGPPAPFFDRIVIAYEEQNNFDRSNSASADVGKIMVAFILEYCERHRIACAAVPLGRLKTFAIPTRPRPKKGEPKLPPQDRGKTAMIAAATERMKDRYKNYGFEGIGGFGMTEHEADALWLYWYAKERLTCPSS